MRPRLLLALLLVGLVAGSAAAQSRREATELNESERTLKEKQRRLNEERAKVAGVYIGSPDAPDRDLCSVVARLACRYRRMRPSWAALPVAPPSEAPA